ncbi:hypothetical protein CDV31_015642 [Fusarium ambrosium]|uniref:Rhodopsin domain-containing protein n=1 Tax=Fusarium ambrosium TaxID=131363 RepID=A0A428SLI1_9HYPO|nr:hypothetical protein CDV31_015642 [Fusarium ambrosium]
MAPRDAYLPTCVTFLIIDGVAVCLRFWARGIKNAVGYDDIMMAMSLVGFIVFVVLELEAIRYGIGAAAMEEGFDINKAAMFFTIAQVVYIITTGISKMGVALVLFRLASGADMKVIRSILAATTVILGLWLAWGIGEGSCISSKVIGQTGLAFSVVDMALSWFYALLPIYMLHNTQLRFKMKLSILILLGLGGLQDLFPWSSIATIIRLKFVIQVTNMSSDRGLANPDIVPITVEATLYSILEIGLTTAAKISAFSTYSAYQGEIFVNAGYKNVLVTVITDPAKHEEQQAKST